MGLCLHLCILASAVDVGVRRLTAWPRLLLVDEFITPSSTAQWEIMMLEVLSIMHSFLGGDRAAIDRTVVDQPNSDHS